MNLMSNKIDNKRILLGLTIISMIHLLIVFSMNTTFDAPAKTFSPPKDAVYIEVWHGYYPYYFRVHPNYYHERRVDLWFQSLETEEYAR